MALVLPIVRLDRRALQFSFAAVLAPALGGLALAQSVSGDDLLPFVFGLTAAFAVSTLVVPGLAVAHLRDWIPSAAAGSLIGALLLPAALLSLTFPAVMVIPSLGMFYAVILFAVPSVELRAAAAVAFPASGELRSIRATWAYLPGAVRLAGQVAGATVLVLGSAASAGLFASGLLGMAGTPGSAGATAFVTVAAGAALVVVVGVMVIVGIPPLLLLSPLGGFTRARVQRWVARRAGVRSRALPWATHVVLAALGVVAAIAGVTALVLSISGIGAASVGAVSAMPAWIALMVVLGVRSHLAELLAIADLKTAWRLVRAHPGEMLLASLFQLLALLWLVGMGSFLGVVTGWLALTQAGAPADGDGLLGAWAALAAACCLQAWVTLRSLITLAVLRVMFVQRLLAKDELSAGGPIDPAEAVG